jgi:hypothetical protein
MTLHVPVYRGVPITAEASLLREQVLGSSSLRKRLGARMDGADFEVVARTVPVRPLDDLGVQAAFVKLDVQGYERRASSWRSSSSRCAARCSRRSAATRCRSPRSPRRRPPSSWRRSGCSTRTTR